MQTFQIEIEDQALLEQGLSATMRFFTALASNQKTYKNTTAIVTDIDSPFLNIAYLGEINTHDIHDICENMHEWFSHYQVPWTLVRTALSTPANLHELLLQEKFGVIESVPCMYCDLSTVDTQSHHPGIRVQELLSSDNLLKWIQPICEGFEAKDGGELFRQLNEKVSKETGVLKQFVAYSEEEVVSSGTLFLIDDVVMIHNIATKTSALRRGYGTTLTRHLMNVAKQLGFKHCYLESSDSGYNIYRRCGFKVYGINHYYVKKQ